MSTMADLKESTREGAEQRLLDSEKSKVRRQRRARREVDAEDRPPVTLPTIRSLSDRLAQPRPPMRWRIEGLQQIGHRVLLSAQYKAGKTTLVINLVRALLDGGPFLDQYDVSQVNTVVLLDFEMAEEEPGQLDDWYREAGIKNAKGLRIVPMRGRASAFNILDEAVRARWAAELRGADYVILDCVRPVLDALGLDENHDAGKFLTAFDALLQEAGVRDACVVQHMGHTGERSRGDSRFQDWPDVIWTLVREAEDPSSRRFIKAFGRGVDVAEVALSYNASNHRLGLGLGSRQDQKAEAVIPAIISFVQGEATPPNESNIRKVVKKAEDVSDKLIRAALTLAVKRRLLTVTQGPSNAKLYSIPQVPF